MHIAFKTYETVTVVFISLRFQDAETARDYVCFLISSGF